MKYTQDELDYAVRIAKIDSDHAWYMRWFEEAKRIYTSTMPV